MNELMQIFRRCAVVGSDGVVGRSLLKFSNRIAEETIGTTRRDGSAAQLHLDLVTQNFDALLKLRPEVAFLCAGMTAIGDCENNPERSWLINVEATTQLARQLLACGCFVVFLSSNTVFDGCSPWPDETAPYSPSNEYGRQKVAAEQALRALPGADERVAIVRLSKVLLPDEGVIGNLFQNLKQGLRCSLFSDLKMSPVSLQYVTESLFHIALQRRAGVFHLSGAEELSYSEYAKKLATRYGYDADLIEPVESTAAAATVLFRPEHPGLRMRLTTEWLGLAPEPLEHMFNALKG